MTLEPLIRPSVSQPRTSKWNSRRQLLQKAAAVFVLFLSSSLRFVNGFYINNPISNTLEPNVSKLFSSSASSQERPRRLYSTVKISTDLQQLQRKRRKEQRWKRSRRRLLSDRNTRNDTERARSDDTIGFEPSMIDITLGTRVGPGIELDLHQGPSRITYNWNLSLSSFHMDLHNLAMEDPVKAHDTVNAMRELFYASLQKGNNITVAVIEPDAACYTTVMNGYIQAGKLDEAQAVLDLVEDLAAEDMERRRRLQPHSVAERSSDATLKAPSVTSPLAPTYMTYILMAQAWANDYKDDYSGTSGEKAEAILRQVLQITSDPKPSQSNRAKSRKSTSFPYRESSNGIAKVWTIVVDGWCKRAGISRRAMTRAEELLLEMEQNPLAVVRPNVLTYTSFICGLSRCKQGDMARKAEYVLDRMKRHGVQPDMVAYTAVLNCWAKAVNRRERGMAANRAISLLSEMEHLYINKKVYSAKPSMVTYTTALAAIGNCLDPVSPLLAEGIIKRMRKFQESGAIANLKPTTAIYNAVIFALGNSPISKRQLSALRAEMLLDEMMSRAQQGERDVQPDVRTWAAVLRAWTRSKQPDAAENAQRLLDKMEYRYKNGLSQIRPNFVCYTTVIGAWGYSKSKDALDKMEQILKQMEISYEETLEPDFRPNTVSYVTCIDAFVGRNEPDAAQRAQGIVDRMMQLYSKGLGHVRPTRPVFDVLIQAWSRSKDKGAAQNAEKIFHWMENQYKAGDDLVRPNEITICGVLNAWANQAEYGGAARAMQIWEHMNSVLAQNDRGLRPTIAMANIVIKAIARSKDPDAVMKAERVLLQLEEDYQAGRSHVRPVVMTYSSVINACAYCVGNASKRADALQTALRTFYKLYNMEDENANNITYGTMIKAIQNLMPVSEERVNLVQELFDMCCDDGCVDYFVLSQVRFASPQLYRDLVEGPCGLGGPGLKHGLDAVLKNLPAEWTVNTID